MTNVRTRFAPSPTGYMHIGGMRTALFNWLWARHNNGQFVLRIDDTDRQRNVDEALAPILRAFRWLGLDWDEGPEVGGPFEPYFQSQRDHLYQQAAERLLSNGKAYRDFDTPEQIKADREAAEREKRNYLNVRRSLEFTDEQIEQFLEEKRPYVVRFLVPREQTVAIDDVVRGHVEWDCSLIADPVIQRGDGSPLYNFANVVDDAHMQITHVIRGEEHLSNTPIQVLIHQALGNELPLFAHIPYVAAPGSKEKLSKRENKIDKYRRNPQFKKMFELADRVFPQIGQGSSETLNPVMVEYYERIGFLPAAVLNALARLGWSLDDKTEIMSLESVVENFTLQRVIKSPAGLDPDKLFSYQQHWMGELSLEEKIDGCLPYLVKAGLVQAVENRSRKSEVGSREPGARSLKPEASEARVEVVVDDDVRAFLGRLITALDDRVKLFSDILGFDEYFVSDEQLAYDEQAFQKRVRKEGAAELLGKFKNRLAETEPFDAPTLDKLLHEFCESEGIKIGEIIHALRVAVSGKPAGPGMFDCLSLLGKDRCLNRIERAVSLI